jgi:hypothetical protein
LVETIVAPLPLIEEEEFPEDEALAETAYEMNIMGVDRNGFSIHVKATGFTSAEDVDAKLRYFSESWMEQGVKPRAQDQPRSSAPAVTAVPDVFQPGQSQNGVGANCDTPGCNGQVNDWRKDDGSVVTGATLANARRRRGEKALCYPCKKQAGR